MKAKERIEQIEADEDVSILNYLSGMQEVVKFIVANKMIPLCDYRTTGTIRQSEEHRKDCRRCKWQAFLKEKGLND